MKRVLSKYDNPDRFIQRLEYWRREDDDRHGRFVVRWGLGVSLHTQGCSSARLAEFRAGDNVVITGQVVAVSEALHTGGSIESEIKYKPIETRRVEKP